MEEEELSAAERHAAGLPPRGQGLQFQHGVLLTLLVGAVVLAAASMIAASLIFGFFGGALHAWIDALWGH